MLTAFCLSFFVLVTVMFCGARDHTHGSGHSKQKLKGFWLIGWLGCVCLSNFKYICVCMNE